MLHHISFPVKNLERSTKLYDKSLTALGYQQVCSGEGFAGYGIAQGKDKLLLVANPDANHAGPGFHLALAAPTREAVDKFHAIALALGALNNGGPGLRYPQ